MTSPSADDPHRLADELEHEVERLEQHTAEVGERTRAVRDDWERKRRDPSVPGAQAPESAARDEDESDAQPQSPAREAPPESEGPSA